MSKPEKSYAGVAWDAQGDWAADGGQALTARESLRELLPLVALGWAPEWIHGEGLYCGIRAFARSLSNLYGYHTANTIPKRCTFPHLLKTLLSKEFIQWRNEQVPVAMSLDEAHLPEFNNKNNFFSVDDLRYLLEYMQVKEFLPIKFRLGVIGHTSKNRGIQLTTILIQRPITTDNEPHPVIWLHNIRANHWESIGPRPSYDGLALFKYWGLHAAAKEIVEQGLYKITPQSAQKNAQGPSSEDFGDKLLRLKARGVVYKHPSHQTAMPYQYKEKDHWFYGLTARSEGHDRYDRDHGPVFKSAELEGFVWEKSVTRVEEYPTTDPIDGLTVYKRKKSKLIMRNLKGEKITKYIPLEDQKDMLGGINRPYSPTKAKGGTSSSPPKSSPAPAQPSTPETSPPDPVSVPSALCTGLPGPSPSPRSFKKRGSGPGANAGGSPSKKPKRDDDVRYPVAHPAHGVGFERSIHRPYSARHLRLFRAKEDSNLKSHGDFFDNLDYKMNDLLVAIEPIPDKPYYPFWARTQDLREGVVSPGQLEEFTEELCGKRYLPYGLQDDDVLTPVPMTFNTYLLMGERHCNSLRSECGVDYDAQWPNDVIKQIMEHRLRRGIPIAFWKGLDAVMLEYAPPPIVERYVRMKNYNSNTFHPDTQDGRAFVWMEHPLVKYHYLPRSNQVVYAHDMNWGLQLRRAKHWDDLKSEDTKFVREINKIMPPSYYPKPVAHRPSTLLQKTVQKGKHFLFGKPTSGKETAFDFQTTSDVDFWKYKKTNGFNNSDPTPREVVATQTQHPRLVGGHGKALQFMKGDRIFMEVPLGARPYQDMFDFHQTDLRQC